MFKISENCRVKDITEEGTFTLLKFLESNVPVLWKCVSGSINTALKLQLKEKLAEHLDNKYSSEIVDKKIHNLRSSYRSMIKKEAQKDEPTSNEEDIKVLKFLESNVPVLWKSVSGSINTALKLQLKEKLVEHLDNKYSSEIVDKKIHNLRSSYRSMIKKEAQKDEPTSNEEDIKVEQCSFPAEGNQENSNVTKIAKSKTKIQ